MPSAAAASETALQVRTTTPPLPDLPVRGFDAVEAVWRMLRRHGHEGGLQAFREAHDLRGSAEALAEPLERAGIQARPAIVTADELCTSTSRRSSSSATARGSCSRIADGTGSSSRGRAAPAPMPAAELGPFLSGYVLDVSPSLPAGKGLWSRLRALLLHHRRPWRSSRWRGSSAAPRARRLPRSPPRHEQGAARPRAIDAPRRRGLGVLLVAAFQACIGWFRDRVVLFLVTRMAVSAERGVLQHLLRLPFPVLDKMTVGERLQAFNERGRGARRLAERAARRGPRWRHGRHVRRRDGCEDAAPRRCSS